MMFTFSDSAEPDSLLYILTAGREPQHGPGSQVITISYFLAKERGFLAACKVHAKDKTTWTHPPRTCFSTLKCRMGF